MHNIVSLGEQAICANCRAANCLNLFILHDRGLI
jgi:hypothetical protein